MRYLLTAFLGTAEILYGLLAKGRAASICEHNHGTQSAKRNNLTSFVSSKSLSFGTLQWGFLQSKNRLHPKIRFAKVSSFKVHDVFILQPTFPVRDVPLVGWIICLIGL